MINEERFWESAISEAVRQDSPPDVTAKVLAELAEAPKPAADKGRGKLILRIGLEVLAAASVVLLIGWLTGLLSLPKDVEGPEPEPKQIAAAPGAEYELSEGKIELKQGWLLVTTGAPDVFCDGSVLNKVDGQVLVHAGSMPTGEQAEAVAAWLNANKLEMGMIGTTKNWAIGVGLAALVISGNAMLDGEHIEAQEKTEKAAGNWITVRTVMDIDLLPEDAKWVRGEKVSGAHLEFLADHASVEAIDFRQCGSLRPAQIEALARMSNLKSVDLRGAYWDERPDYAPLGKLPKLEHLQVDYVPRYSDAEDDGELKPGWEKTSNVTSTLRLLSTRGVKITLGNLSDIEGSQLSDIVSSVSTLRELNLSWNNQITNADLKGLAGHPNIEALNLEGCERVTELGLAYLARANRLKTLRVTTPLTEAIVYQLSLMTQLEELELPKGSDETGRGSFGRAGAEELPALIERVRAVFSKLSALKNLKRLEWSIGHVFDARVFSEFALNTKLKTISLTGDYSSLRQDLNFLTALQIPRHLPVELLEVESSGDVLEQMKSEKAQALLKEIEAADSLAELSIRFDHNILPEDLQSAGTLPTVLKKFSNLKRVQMVADNPESVKLYEAYAKAFLGDWAVEVIYVNPNY